MTQETVSVRRGERAQSVADSLFNPRLRTRDLFPASAPAFIFGRNRAGFRMRSVIGKQAATAVLKQSRQQKQLTIFVVKSS